MCWFCENWERRSPKTFARWVSTAQRRGSPHDAHVIAYAVAVADDILSKIDPSGMSWSQAFSAVR
jgi:hypothetical protein